MTNATSIAGSIVSLFKASSEKSINYAATVLVVEAQGRPLAVVWRNRHPFCFKYSVGDTDNKDHRPLGSSFARRRASLRVMQSTFMPSARLASISATSLVIVIRMIAATISCDGMTGLLFRTELNHFCVPTPRECATARTPIIEHRIFFGIRRDGVANFLEVSI